MKEENFKWFWTLYEGRLGVHKDKIMSIKDDRLLLSDGTIYELSPDPTHRIENLLEVSDGQFN